MKRKARKYQEPRHIRTRNALKLCFFILPGILYLFYCAGGLFQFDVSLSNISSLYQWCLCHPLQCYTEKTAAMVTSGILVWLIFTLSYYSKMDNNFMPGKEYGSAKWGDVDAFNRKYASKNPKENKVLSENVRFRYDSSTLRNNNIFVCGGSGAGKTSFFLTPNLLNHYGSNIIADSKGTLIEELGGWLSQQENTNVYQLNLCDMEKSMRVNPFLFIRKEMDLLKMVTNLMQNTDAENISASAADPFWAKAEKMFLYSIFSYVWMECPTSAVSPVTGEVFVLQKTMESVLYLIDEAKIEDDETPSLLDVRMKNLEKKNPKHPAVRAYNRYRSGPDDTIRSVLMTVNARMQIFDNKELLEIFSGNDIPLDEFGTGKDGDKTTRSYLFMVIPDDDDTYNFVPGMIYTLLLQMLYQQARCFGGKLPIEVGFWLDEFANTKMPSNFDKIMATCRSRGIYCIPMLQSLSQMKKLFSEGAWEGVVGNCDTFLYLGGNESSTFEYISKLLGEWTIDKRSHGENKGANGSSSENVDVLGRKLMMEYEIRLLPNDECIMFIRGERPIRDKKWFPWKHEEYAKAKACGAYDISGRKSEREPEPYRFLNEEMLDYQKQMSEKGSNINIYKMDVMDFMKMDLDALEKEQEKLAFEYDGMQEQLPVKALNDKLREELEQEEAERNSEFLKQYESLSLLDIFAFENLGDTRRNVIQEMLKKKIPEEDIRVIVHPMLSEGEVLAKKRAYYLMHSLGA